MFLVVPPKDGLALSKNTMKSKSRTKCSYFIGGIVIIARKKFSFELCKGKYN
jgi:hypothetical protein